MSHWPLATSFGNNQELVPQRFRPVLKKAYQFGFDKAGVLKNNFKYAVSVIKMIDIQISVKNYALL